MPEIYTYDHVANAVKKAVAYLGPIDIRAFAEVIDAPLSIAIDILSKNEKHFELMKVVVGSGQLVVGMKQADRSVSLDYATLSAAFTRKHPKNITPATVEDLARNFSSRPIRWEQSFSQAVAVFSDSDKNGADALAKGEQKYSAAIKKRMQRLGTVSGRGQVPELYIFGVILDQQDLDKGNIDGYEIFLADRVTADIGAGTEWHTLMKPSGKFVADSAQLITEAQARAALRDTELPDEAKALIAAPTEPQAAAITPPLGGQIPPAAPTGGRRTLVQLNAARTEMVNTLVAAGHSLSDAQEKILKPEKFTDAEKAFKEMQAQGCGVSASPAQTVVPGAERAVEAKVTAPPAAAVDPASMLDSLITKAPPAAVPLPPPAIVSAPPLATVADLKKDIVDTVKSQGGTPPPPAQVSAPVAIPLPPPVSGVVAPPGAAQPVSAPPVITAATAAGLLDSLLASAGQ